MKENTKIRTILIEAEERAAENSRRYVSFEELISVEYQTELENAALTECHAALVKNGYDLSDVDKLIADSPDVDPEWLKKVVAYKHD